MLQKNKIKDYECNFAYKLYIYILVTQKNRYKILISLDQEFVADETPCPYNCWREGSVYARLSKAQVSNNV
jgi:hypothetical protein